MSFKDIIAVQWRGMEAASSAGVIGLHMVSGPLVGVAIGYGLDAWLGTGPVMKVIFLFVGIGAGFLNVYRDTRRLVRRLNSEEDPARASAVARAEREKEERDGEDDRLP